MLEMLIDDEESPIELEIVFTPAAVSRAAYFCRNQLERQFRRALISMNKHILVHGPAGTGKSSLIQHVLRHSLITPIIVNCTSFTLYDDIKEAVFGKLADKNAGQYSNDRLARHLENKNRVLVLEDYHMLSTATMAYVKELAAVISGQDRAVLQARMVLCGNNEMEEEAAALFNSVLVPAMPGEELEEIIIRGECLLNVTFSAELRQCLLKFAAGSARELHQVCYKFCKENNILYRCEKKTYFENTTVFYKV